MTSCCRPLANFGLEDARPHLFAFVVTLITTPRLSCDLGARPFQGRWLLYSLASLARQRIRIAGNRQPNRDTEPRPARVRDVFQRDSATQAVDNALNDG